MLVAIVLLLTFISTVGTSKEPISGLVVTLGNDRTWPEAAGRLLGLRVKVAIDLTGPLTRVSGIDGWTDAQVRVNAMLKVLAEL